MMKLRILLLNLLVVYTIHFMAQESYSNDVTCMKADDNIAVITASGTAEKRKMYKGVNANVDFYSGLVYHMLGIPEQLYTPIFAAARIVGWSAHRLEELINVDKIIRPAYMPLAEYREYKNLNDR